ncbi:MAG TPA: hypothetical protein VHW47_10485 [Acidimicrobiales bacterium]|jgi:chromosome segregation ATPase|nr:hypothetical protein [Acidimicrobiales bacterium]
MPNPFSTGSSPDSICALPGCETIIVQSERGGRPRQYCSDTHRAEARRRRLSGGPGGGDPITLLDEAIRRLQAADDRASARTSAVVAEARAQATAEVLAARRDAASARREAVEAGERAVADQAAAEALGQELARGQEEIGQLRSSLQGAQQALQEAMVRHHQDVQALEHRMAAMAAIHRDREAASATELDRYRLDAVAAEARRAMAEERAATVETTLADAGRAAGHLELRASRAEMAVEQVESRLRDAQENLATERRRAAANPLPRPERPRRRGTAGRSGGRRPRPTG